MADLLTAAEALRAARVRYAEAWLRLRLKARSDQDATHRATVETNDEVTIRQAELELAREELRSSVT